MTSILIINLALAVPAVVGLVGFLAWAIRSSGDGPRPVRARPRRQLPRPVFPTPTLRPSPRTGPGDRARAPAG